VKLTLEGCKHAYVETYKRGSGFALCMHCYQRLCLNPARSSPGWVPDLPVAPCDHREKKPINTVITKRQSHNDAMCLECGSALRHPEGPGYWEEVVFNGYVIQEPW